MTDIAPGDGEQAGAATTEAVTNLTPFTGLDTVEQSVARRERVLALSDEALAHLCPLLFTHGIGTVAVMYDGGGDEGQIERLEAYGDDGPVDLPEVECQARGLQFDGSVFIQDTTLPKALETFAYEILEAVHDGWENSDGAYGELTIDVASRTASLEHNTRVIAVETETLELGEVPCPTLTTTH